MVDARPGEPMLEQRAPASTRGGRWGLWALLAAVTLCWLPFIDKPVHVDDPEFIWMAQQIQQRPWDFYGFSANYYGSPQRADQFLKNPPLVSYYLAGVASVFGWNERALHAAMLVAVLLAVIGTYELARRFLTTTAGALLAAMITAFSPAFFVSAMTMIGDVLMLPLFIWAIVFWIDGVRGGGNHPRLAVSAMLILAATMAKYFGAALIPLFFVYALVHWCGARWGLLWLLIPVVGLLGFELYTRHLYGGGALAGAVDYATSSRGRSGDRIRLLTGLSFLGGCIVTAVPVGVAALWQALRRCGWSGWTSLFVVAGLIAGIMRWQAPGIKRIAQLDALPPLVWGQLIVFTAAGVLVLLPLIDELKQWRWQSADSLLLMLAVIGTFVFILAFNWTVSARNYLPMAPILAITAVRWIERHAKFTGSSPQRWGLWFSFVAGLAPIAVLVLHADVKLAQSARDAAGMVHDFAIAAGSPPVWFQGHWGFQYYMQQWGAEPVDQVASRCAKGDLLVMAWDNANIVRFPSRAVRKLGRVAPLPGYWIASMHLQLMAGFHSDMFGPLPFAVGNGRPERYDIYILEHNLIWGNPEDDTPSTQQNR